MMDTIAWNAGIFSGLSTFFAQVALDPSSAGWMPIVLQAGMAGIVAMLLLKFFPDLVRAQREQNERFLTAMESQQKAHASLAEAQRIAHEVTIKRLVESHERQMEAFRSWYARPPGHQPQLD
jgi:hypothetical protein